MLPDQTDARTQKTDENEVMINEPGLWAFGRCHAALPQRIAWGIPGLGLWRGHAAKMSSPNVIWTMDPLATALPEPSSAYFWTLCLPLSFPGIIFVDQGTPSMESRFRPHIDNTAQA